jgi:hypothetical protein
LKKILIPLCLILGLKSFLIEENDTITNKRRYTKVERGREEERIEKKRDVNEVTKV